MGHLPNIIAPSHPAPAGASADVPGLEFAGEVAEAGAEVRDWKPGDRVMAIVAGGAYAEYARIPAEHALPIPEGWTFDQAAAVPEALHAVGSSVGVASSSIPVVDRVFPAADVVEAHRYLEANRNFGSVVLSWR